MSIVISTQIAPQFPLPFSQGLKAGDFVYVSGQVGINPETKELAGPGIEEQTNQCLFNIEAILNAAGLDLGHIVKINAHLSKEDDFAGFNQSYQIIMQPPYPTRTTVISGIGHYLVEIDAIAYAPSRRGER